MTEKTKPAPLSEDEQLAIVSFADIIAFFRRHLAYLTLIAGSVTIVYSVVALAAYFFAPSYAVTSMPFRLEFRGAERGEYPNGLVFNPVEIASTPVLLDVYQQNGLDEFISFDDLKDSVYVLESGDALERLSREYSARLSDSKLTAVDRERIESEFAEKKNSLTRNNYTINMRVPSSLEEIPLELRVRILTDILATWAERTVNDKGVLLFDVSVFSPNIIKGGIAETGDAIVALDILRTRIVRIQQNIDELLDIPGSRVLRTQEHQQSLSELRVQLDDLLQFSIQPLASDLLAARVGEEREITRRYFRSQLSHNRLLQQATTARIAMTKEALQTYQQQMQPSDMASSSRAAASGTESVILNEDFIDRIIGLASNAEDRTYRQELVDRMRVLSDELVPFDREVDYYQSVLTSLDAVNGRASTVEADRLSPGEVEKSIGALADDATAVVRAVNDLYEKASRNLHPSTALYSSHPATTKSVRALTSKKLLLLGILILLASIPIATVVALIRDRVS